MKMSGSSVGDVVTAVREYRQGEKSLEIGVIGGEQAESIWASYGSGFQFESDDQLIKVETINGFTVGMAYNKKDKEGGIAVKLASNAVFVVNFKEMTLDEALEVAKKFDWSGLSSLFK
ncbi:MAG: hypothetical protein H5T71_06865 [Chloroflexi bacterium]|nr:hypothetical protein [Chloroflexota bacterium]